MLPLELRPLALVAVLAISLSALALEHPARIVGQAQHKTFLVFDGRAFGDDPVWIRV